jgi:type IV secretory pathway TrbF-like protein
LTWGRSSRSALPLSPDFHAVEGEWRERTYNKQGALVSDDQWKAIVNLVTYNLDELKNPRELRNPLFVFITDYSWRKTGRAKP